MLAELMGCKAVLRQYKADKLGKTRPLMRKLNNFTQPNNSQDNNLNNKRLNPETAS
jgi:hypothetical protein